MASPTKVVLDALASHLRTNMASMTATGAVKTDFPQANEKIVLPGLTLVTGAPLFTPCDPYVLSRGVVAANKALVKYIVGMYDFQLQADLWARSKSERHTLFEEFFNAFHKQIVPMGLSLQLGAYHGLWCRYDQGGYEFDDSEAASQRAEWRVTIRLLAHCRAVREREEFVIVTTETNLTTQQ